MTPTAIKAMASMFCLTLVVVVAMIQGHDGVALAGGMSAIAGLGGFTIGRNGNKHKGG